MVIWNCARKNASLEEGLSRLCMIERDKYVIDMNIPSLCSSTSSIPMVFYAFAVCTYMYSHPRVKKKC